MSLAAQLLDYSSDEDEDVQDFESHVEEEHENGTGGSEVPGADDIDIHDASINLTTISDITKVSRLRSKLEPLIEKVKAQAITFDYELTKTANESIVEIQQEVAIIDNYIRLHYNAIFPELGPLVPRPVEYAKTVRVLGTEVEQNVARREEELKQILPKEKLLVITMSSSLRQSDYEIPANIDNLISACDLCINLDEYQRVLMEYVASNLQAYAPNLSNLIGSTTSAQLIAAVGSLQNLAATPSCNLAALGNKRQTGIGYGAANGVRLQGYLYENPVIYGVPDEYKKQALRMFSAKVTLCARVDLSKSKQDGSLGQQYRREILEKLDKLVAPPDQAKVKALPAPVDHKSKKRAGKRLTKMKKNFQSSELQKLQNKMSFGEREETYIDGYGNEIGLGMAARSNNGSIRRIGDMSDGARAKMSKNMAHRLNIASNATQEDDGLLSFDNPDLKKPVQKLGNGSNAKWYDEAAFEGKRSAEELPSSNTLKRLKRA